MEKGKKLGIYNEGYVFQRHFNLCGRDGSTVPTETLCSSPAVCCRRWELCFLPSLGVHRCIWSLPEEEDNVEPG